MLIITFIIWIVTFLLSLLSVFFRNQANLKQTVTDGGWILYENFESINYQTKDINELSMLNQQAVNASNKVFRHLNNSQVRSILQYLFTPKVPLPWQSQTTLG